MATEQRYLVLDTETTGLDPKAQDVIQVAGVLQINGKEYERFNFKCQPFSYENIQVAALKINRTTVEMLKTYPTPAQTCNQLCDLLDRYVFGYKTKFTLIGQNVAFDINFLKEFFIKNGREALFDKYFQKQAVDLVSISAFLRMNGKIPDDSLKLTTIAKSLGHNTEEAHDALADVDLVIKVLASYSNLLK